MAKLPDSSCSLFESRLWGLAAGMAARPGGCRLVMKSILEVRFEGDWPPVLPVSFTYLFIAASSYSLVSLCCFFEDLKQ